MHDMMTNIENDIAKIQRNTDPKHIEWRNTSNEYGDSPKDFGF
jgi:hypothetical protein